MASLRKRYQDRIEAGPRQNEPPVSTPPVKAAEPPPAVEPKPIEQPQTESPADTAARTALRERLREMENAEALTHQAQQPQPQYAAEPQQQQQPQQPAMPAQVQKWLAEHPQYCDPNDHVAQAEIYTATLKCNRDGKSWDQPDFIPTLERHLGIAPRSNGQQAQPHRPIEKPSPAPAAPPRYEAPRQQRSNVPVSAPPTRDVPSMATGRPTGGPVRLTDAQREAARFSGISEEKYAEKLELMNRMKA